MEDELDKSWSMVVHLKPCDLFDMGEDEDGIIYESESYRPQDLETLFLDRESSIPLVREIDDNNGFLRFVLFPFNMLVSHCSSK